MKIYRAKIVMSLIISSLTWGCTSLEKISERVFLKETYSRTYHLNFSSFHSQLNSFLQEYARKNKGNSFQIRRLDSAEVVWQGIFKMKNSSQSFPVEIVARSIGEKRSNLELKFVGEPSRASSISWGKACSEFFQAIEKGLNIKPV